MLKMPPIPGEDPNGGKLRKLDPLTGDDANAPEVAGPLDLDDPDEDGEDDEDE